MGSHQLSFDDGPPGMFMCVCDCPACDKRPAKKQKSKNTEKKATTKQTHNSLPRKKKNKNIN